MGLGSEATASLALERTSRDGFMLMCAPRCRRRWGCRRSGRHLLPGVAADASSSRSVKLTDFKVTPSVKSVGHGNWVTFVVHKAASQGTSSW